MSQRIREFSESTGLSTDTLRYYEKLGLLNPERNAVGHRIYTHTDAAWLSFIQRLKATNMPLAQIIEYARLRYLGDCTLAERYAILEAHQRVLQEKIKELMAHQAHLEEKIQIYQDMMARQKTV